VLFIVLVFCVVVFGGVRVVHLFSFLCCVFGGSVLFIVLVFCVVVFGGIRVVHRFSFLCCVLCFVCLRLCLVCPILLMFLDCPFFIAPLFFSSIYSAGAVCSIGRGNQCIY
jgi:hypothetical protein